MEMETQINGPEQKDKVQTNTDQQTKVRQIGHYILGQTIGQGTFGKVKVGIHVLTDEKVAIKILEKNKIADAADVERVTREIQILRMIRHANVIQLYEIIETPKQLYLVMEYATQGELFDYIVQNKRIKDVEASRFFNQIIQGVEYLHKLNIVHRDLKPENLLIDHQNTLKLVDFGLSNIYKPGDTLKTACGSPCYAAPEMISGKRYKGIQVDVWSCGVILFAMLAGFLPFEDQNTSNLYKKIINGDFKIPKFVSNEGRDLILKILNTDPNDRYTIEDIKRHQWYNLCRTQSAVTQNFHYALRPLNEGIIVGKHVIPIDYNILKQAEDKNFERQTLIYSITNNKHNSAATTYYLLLKKHLREGGVSPGDLTGELFKSQLIQKQHEPKKQETLPIPENKIIINQTQYITVIDNSVKISKKKEDMHQQKNNSFDIGNQNSSGQSPSRRRFSEFENPQKITIRNSNIRNNYLVTAYNQSKSPPSYNFNIKIGADNSMESRDSQQRDINHIKVFQGGNAKNSINPTQAVYGGINYNNYQQFNQTNYNQQTNNQNNFQVKDTYTKPKTRNLQTPSVQKNEQFVIRVNKKDRGYSLENQQLNIAGQRVQSGNPECDPRGRIVTSHQQQIKEHDNKLNQTTNFKTKLVNYFNI